MKNIFMPGHRKFESIERGGMGEVRRRSAFVDGVRPAKESNGDFHSSGPKTIVVPLDLRESSHSALAIARNLALESGAVLVLVHAVWLNIAGEERGIHSSRLIQEMCQEARLQLGELAAELGKHVKTRPLVCGGYPSDVILEAALQLGADAIVMRTHGRRGWRRWFHRNTASKVVKQSPCPVWLIAPGNMANTVDLMVMGRAAADKTSPQFAIAENPGAFQSLLRILSF